MSPLTTFVSAAMTLAGVAAAGSLQLLRGEQQPLVLTHGIASGDVTDSSAVIWARASGPAQMHVEIATNPAMDGAKSSGAYRRRQEQTTRHRRQSPAWNRILGIGIACGWRAPAGAADRMYRR